MGWSVTGELVGHRLSGAHFSTTQTLRRDEEFVWWKSAFFGWESLVICGMGEANGKGRWRMRRAIGGERAAKGQRDVGCRWHAACLAPGVRWW